ncbi:MAG: 1-phosphofructokinase [Chthonomonadales bacterium]
MEGVILTVTLNAAVDKTFTIPGFSVDRVYRPTRWRITAGGKGINVARVYRILGGSPLATGFLGGINGRLILHSLQQEGIPAEFVRVAEEARECIAIIDPDNRTQTEINEVGPTVRPSEVKRFLLKFEELLGVYRFQWIVLSGSIPPGVPPATYAQLINKAKSHGVDCVLDTSGLPLTMGIEAGPWMVKPNLYELEAWCGRNLRSLDEVLEAGESARKKGIEVVAVTMGERGAIVMSRDGTWRATAPPVEFVSAVGSGDAFVAAFLWSVEQGTGVAEALRAGVAAGSANAATFGAGFIERSEVERLAALVQLERL